MRITASAAVPLSEVELRVSRSSGPGGQHANVTASRVEAVFDVAASQALTEDQKARVAARCGPRVTAVAQDTRSQARNREIARERLAELIGKALTAPRPRIPTRPTLGSQRRRLAAKAQRGTVKALRGSVDMADEG